MYFFIFSVLLDFFVASGVGGVAISDEQKKHAELVDGHSELRCQKKS